MNAKSKKLKEALIQTSEQRQLGSGRNFKKKYFLKNLELILELTENRGVKYMEVLKIMSEDGIVFNYDYFRRLMAAAKKTCKTSAERQINIKDSPPSNPALILPVTDNETMGAEHGEEMSPEKAAYIAENKRIKGLNISSKEKRELMVAAAEAYSRTQNPLDRK